MIVSVRISQRFLLKNIIGNLRTHKLWTRLWKPAEYTVWKSCIFLSTYFMISHPAAAHDILKFWLGLQLKISRYVGHKGGVCYIIIAPGRRFQKGEFIVYPPWHRNFQATNSNVYSNKYRECSQEKLKNSENWFFIIGTSGQSHTISWLQDDASKAICEIYS